MGTLKQRVFASAFGATDPANALKRYFDTFDKEEPELDYEVEEFVPESPQDVMDMFESARRAGVIS